MATITEDMTINEVIKKHPETMGVFNDFKVDSCCGGGQSIAVTAAVAGANVPELITALNESVKRDS
jgi:regulator of cell morphogenesis and NO signaling